jgi:hypothetical protein
MSNKFQILCKRGQSQARLLCRVQPKLYNFKNYNLLNCLNIRYLNFENYLLFVF